MIELNPHDPAWRHLARGAAERLAGALGGNLIRVEHIGSTAIPGIRAKPVVDLLPIVQSLREVDSRREAIESLGYRWWGEFGIDGRRFCTLSDAATGIRRVNMHIYQSDSPEIERHLAFREYLLQDCGEARAYEVQKVAAAALHPDDVLAYNDAKSAWIRACERRALAWWRRR